MNEAQLGAGAAREVATNSTGLIQQATGEVEILHKRCTNVINQLEEIGARILGPDDLPRNQRETLEKVNQPIDTSAPTPVRSEMFKHAEAIDRLRVSVNDMEELAQWLRQL